ncbi:NADH-quinone oxidoreductase subunit NuoG [Magnetococcales bacterium HHB-1]
MHTLIINGKEISVKRGATIMDAAEQLGVYIPHFCYHPKLPISGNCRMCLVEVEKMPKPVVACAMPVNDGMVVETNSEMVKKARRGVMEFLLINHPLDCPVCDQGGECDLQDFAMKFGPDRSRYFEDKRRVGDKDLGPLIETVMNRCIHCTRCIRFSQEVAGLEEMGAIDRGDRMLVGPGNEDRTLTSELTGNLAEICPVGALNLKPFHYQARGWELSKTDGICNHCSVGCHIRRDHLNNEVKRVMSRRCDEVNDAWLCDKGRFSYDGILHNRLETPSVRDENGGELNAVSWDEALDQAAKILKSVKPEEVAGLAAEDLPSAEELFAFQDLLRQGLGTTHLDYRLRQRDFSASEVALTRADLMMNTPLERLEESDFVLLVGADTRFETPLLNYRLRKASLNGATLCSIYPTRLNHNFSKLEELVVSMGEEVQTMKNIVAALKGGTTEVGEDVQRLTDGLKKAERPVVILGDYAVNHPSAENLRRLSVAILQACNGIRSDWNGFNRVISRCATSAAQDFGILPHRGPGYRRLKQTGFNARDILKAAAEGKIKVLFLLGAEPALESVDTVLAKKAMEKASVIFLGAYQRSSSTYADVILPGLVNGEKSAIYTNCEGRPQHSEKALVAPGEAKEDWRILRALSDRFATPLAYNTLEALRQKMGEADHRYNISGFVDGALPPSCDHSPVTQDLPLNDAGSLAPEEKGFKLMVKGGFYRDDAVARQSVLMDTLDSESGVRISPEDAAALSLKDGDRVRLIRGERTVDSKAILDGKVPQGMVCGVYGDSSSLIQDLCQWEEGFPVVSLVSL